MRWLVVAGEPSGDRLAATVLAAARDAAPGWRFEGVVGDASVAAGAARTHPLPDGAMGLWDVLPGVLALRALAARLVAAAARYDGALLVDYHGFNLRLGRALRRRGVPVVVLSAPQVWAWRPGRAASLDGCADALGCLLDVEPPLLRALGVRRARVAFVGHPAAERAPPSPDGPRRALALLPGSRPRELARLTPAMTAAARALVGRGSFHGYEVAAPPERAGDPSLAGLPVRAGLGAAAALLGDARAALACSGTVTLECALAGVPTVVAYRTDALTAFVGRRVLRTPWLALPNVLLGRALQAELWQDDVTPGALAAAVERALSPEHRAATTEAAATLRARLRAPEGCGARVVALMRDTAKGDRS